MTLFLGGLRCSTRCTPTSARQSAFLRDWRKRHFLLGGLRCSARCAPTSARQSTFPRDQRICRFRSAPHSVPRNMPHRQRADSHSNQNQHKCAFARRFAPHRAPRANVGASVYVPITYIVSSNAAFVRRFTLFRVICPNISASVCVSMI